MFSFNSIDIRKNTMKSRTMKRLYSSWEGTAEQVDLVDSIFAMAERAGERGEAITECYGPDDILTVFETVEQAADFLGVKARQRREIRNA